MSLLAQSTPVAMATNTGPASLQLSPQLAFRRHWREYVMEAAGLGSFMISACFFGAVYENLASPVRQAIASSLLRRILMGISMGLTAVGIIYSPWGKQSGAHINPSVTLTFWRLGKIQNWDAFFYVGAQFAGALLGVGMAAVLFGKTIAGPNVHYVATVPGDAGMLVAFAAEFLMAFGLMSMVLYVSNHPRLSRLTGVFAGLLVAAYITVAAPFSGMSMNPARTLGSALAAGIFTGLWIYFTAPLLGMLCAAQVYLWRKGQAAVQCCKLHHNNSRRCIFCGANTGLVI